MYRRVLSIMTMGVVIGLNSQIGRSDGSKDRHEAEQQLLAVLQWEVLWRDSPEGFRVPENGTARLAMALGSGWVSYCSRDIGVCARYKTDSNRGWERVVGERYAIGASDEAALLSFVSRGSKHEISDVVPKSGQTLGPGGLTGHLGPEGAPIWTTTLRLGNRAEIIQQYRQIHPQALEGLKNWILGATPQKAAMKSITIACFAPTDPMVYYYIDRPPREPLIMAVIWDKDRQFWAVASSRSPSQGVSGFREMRETIESVACLSLRF
jgi:hypothetical protein